MPQEQVEKKWEACDRLEREGRYKAFRDRVAFYRSAAGGRLKRDEAFYRALAEFPPR